MAAQAAAQAGLFPDHRARLWENGEWQDVLLFGFEVHGEPVYELDPRVKALLQEAHAALRARDAAPAIQALEQALQIEPDLPPLLDDLATAYRLQKRPMEAEAIYRRVVGSHPDNVIARSDLAQMMTEQGKLEEARRLLDSIVETQRLHYSELAAFWIANIELNLAKGEPDAARSWLSMWEEIDPDDSSVALYQVRLGKPPGRWVRPGRRK